MSADNGYLIRQNGEGKFVLQMYFLSNDSYPPIEDAPESMRFDSLEAAVRDYAQFANDEYYSEYGLNIQVPTKTGYVITGLNNQKEKKTMQTQTFVNNQYDVEVVQVTEENFDEVLAWCGGVSHTEPQGRYIQVPVRNPLRPRQEKAFVGDWVLKSKTGFKSYTDVAFHKSFSPKASPNAPLDIPQELFTTSDPVAEESSNVFQQAEALLQHFGQVNPKDQITGKRR